MSEELHASARDLWRKEPREPCSPASRTFKLTVGDAPRIAVNAERLRLCDRAEPRADEPLHRLLCCDPGSRGLTTRVSNAATGTSRPGDLCASIHSRIPMAGMCTAPCWRADSRVASVDILRTHVSVHRPRAGRRRRPARSGADAASTTSVRSPLIPAATSRAICSVFPQIDSKTTTACMTPPPRRISLRSRRRADIPLGQEMQC